MMFTGGDMSEVMKFSTRKGFSQLAAGELDVNSWYLGAFFGKAGGPKTIKAGEALEEALCFGWIDGQMQSIDDKIYKSIFPCAGKTANGRRKIKRWQKNWNNRVL